MILEKKLQAGSLKLVKIARDTSGKTFPTRINAGVEKIVSQNWHRKTAM